MYDLQLNDREHTDRRCVYRDSDMRCIYHHHCDTDVTVNNDNIWCIVYSSDMCRIEDSVLVHYSFYYGNITNTLLYYTLYHLRYK